MNRVIPPPVLVLIVAVSPAMSNAAGGKSSAQLLPANDLATLRSAFLARAGHLQAGSPQTDAEEQAELQRHFETVLQLLIARSPSSIETALDRLEQHQGTTWSATERERWRHRLGTRRLLNLVRLRQYQLRGRFPQNEYRNTRVPVFVDHQGTACAVGYLMCRSGWQDAVRQIAMQNNHVYVPDVTTGAIIDWVLLSGLTAEEAALIQPGYLPQYDFFFSDLMSDAPVTPITSEGIRIENFSYRAAGNGATDFTDELPQPEDLGIGVWGWPAHKPKHAVKRLTIGATQFGGLGVTDAGETLQLHINFDVIAPEEQEFEQLTIFTSEGNGISRLGQNGVRRFNDGTQRGMILLETMARSAEGELGSVSIGARDLKPFRDWDGTTLSFDPVKRLRLETRLSLEDAARMSAFQLSFGMTNHGLCDVNDDGLCDASDIDSLHLTRKWVPQEWRYDLNYDGRFDNQDREFWIYELMDTSPGDADLDGIFDSSDLAAVFAAGEYEDQLAQNSGWRTGDWNGDAEFTTRDLVLAFRDGRYEQEADEAVQAVPEPSTALLLLSAALVLARRPRRRS